jgi:mono/diheme cytochrome c family protein
MNPSNAPSPDKRDRLLTGCAFGLFVLFLVQLLLGGFLELQYRATPAEAHRAVSAMQSGGLAVLRGIHYWGSTVLIAGSILILCAMFACGWYRTGRARMWIAAAMLFLASLLSQITGNLLPFDRHGVQTVVVESGVARGMPIAGPLTSKVMLGGDQFNDSTLGLWHMAHIGALLLGLAAFFLFWKASKGERSAGPMTWAPLFLSVVLAFSIAAPLGKAATSADYNSYDAQVSWYTVPMHGSLNAFLRLSPSLGWIGSGAIPTLLVLLVFAAPLLSRRLSFRVIQGVFGALVLYFAVVTLAFGGGFAALTGNRDPVVAVAPLATTATAKDEILFSKGRVLFNTKGCSDCHGKDGGKASGGPSLTDVASRRGTDPSWYEKFIKNPTSVKPNSTMPAVPALKDDETRALAEFLIHLK